MEETAQAEHQTAQDIADNLNRAGHPVEVGDVSPVDLARGAISEVQGAVTGTSKVYDTLSRNGLKVLVERLLKIKGPNDIVVVK